MKYHTVIFDLDGTLLDTLADLKNTCNYTLNLMGFPERSADEVRMFVGNGIINLIRRAVPEGTNEEAVLRTYDLFMLRYKDHCMDETEPYPGISELITALRNAGLKTAVVSNKADSAVQELMDRFFPGQFDAVAGEKEGIRRKPAPDTVFAVMTALDSNPAGCVYIGDSEVDLKTAENAGIPCIAVTWGFRSRELLLEHGAETLAEDPAGLCSLLLAD